MKMTKGKTVVLGAFTLWPFIYMCLFFCFAIGMIIYIAAAGGAPPAVPHAHAKPPLFFFIIFPLHFLTILEVFALCGFYIYHLFKTDLVDKDKKALWAVVLFLGNMFAMPVYWYLYIWKPLTSSEPRVVQ